MTKLAERTNAWFLRPSTCERPSADEHLHIFLALVSLLGPGMKNSDLRVIHAYFRYLLLECDTVTSTAESPTFSEEQRDIFTRLLDFTLPRSQSSRWKLLLWFVRDPKWVFEHFVDDEATRRAYLTLALTLVERPVLPRVKLFLYDCLGFYQRNLDYTICTAASTEFNSSTPMLYASWLYAEVNKAFKLKTMSMLEIWQTVSYLAWFVNLVRAHRTIAAGNNPDLDTYGVISQLLEEQVQLLQRALDTTPLKVEMYNPDSGLLDLTGIHPTKKVKQE